MVTRSDLSSHYRLEGACSPAVLQPLFPGKIWKLYGSFTDRIINSPVIYLRPSKGASRSVTSRICLLNLRMYKVSQAQLLLLVPAITSFDEQPSALRAREIVPHNFDFFFLLPPLACQPNSSVPPCPASMITLTTVTLLPSNPSCVAFSSSFGVLTT